MSFSMSCQKCGNLVEFEGTWSPWMQRATCAECNLKGVVVGECPGDSATVRFVGPCPCCDVPVSVDPLQVTVESCEPCDCATSNEHVNEAFHKLWTKAVGDAN